MQSTNNHYVTARFGVSEIGVKQTGRVETAKLLGERFEQGERGVEDLAKIVELRINPEASGTNSDENGIEENGIEEEEEDDEAAAHEENEEEAEDDEATEEAKENTSSERLRPSAIVRTAGVFPGRVAAVVPAHM